MYLALLEGIPFGNGMMVAVGWDCSRAGSLEVSVGP